VGTALNDDPQLNARHLPPTLDGSRRNLPRPVIIDRHLQLPPTCKLLRNYQNGTGRRPWVLCAPSSDAISTERLSALEKAGAAVIQVPVEAKGNRISVSSILHTLRQREIRSLMVEGGARIIESFFKECSVVDSLIVTVAPTFVGADGVGYAFELGSGSDSGDEPFKLFRTDQIGNDVVILLTAGRSDPVQFI